MLPVTLAPDRQSFHVGGSSFIQRGVLDWPLYGRYLNEGTNAALDIIRDRKLVGANTIALAGMLSWWPGLTPDHPRYWSSMRAFVDMAASEGMRLQWVVFCDTATLMDNKDSRFAHFERFVTTQGDKPNVTFVTTNQPGHPTQSRDLDPREFKRVSNFPVLYARDNPMESGNPVLPTLDFSCYCSSRDEFEGVYGVGHSMAYVVNGWPNDREKWDGTHQVSILFEGPHFRPSGPWSDAGKARQLGRSLAFKGTGGGNFYCDQSSQSQLLRGVERNCAVEFLGNIPQP